MNSFPAVHRIGWTLRSIVRSARIAPQAQRARLMMLVVLSVTAVATALGGSAFATTSFLRHGQRHPATRRRGDPARGAELMKRNPAVVARIEGGACVSEKDADHLWYERAMAARTFLLQHGVAPGQITTIAKAHPAWQAEMRRISTQPCSEYERAVLFMDARVPG